MGYCAYEEPDSYFEDGDRQMWKWADDHASYLLECVKSELKTNSDFIKEFSCGLSENIINYGIAGHFEKFISANRLEEIHAISYLAIYSSNRSHEEYLKDEWNKYIIDMH